MTIVSKKYIFQLLFFALSSYCFDSNLFACDCKDESTTSGSIKYADIMFSGKVISKAVTSNFDSLGVKTTGDPAKIYFFNPTAVIKIKIDKIYKGQPISDTLTILTPTNVESCGYYFEVNQKYIVYAKTTDDLVIKQNLERKTLDNKTFWTNHCTRTQNWNENEENEIIREIK